MNKDELNKTEHTVGVHYPEYSDFNKQPEQFHEGHIKDIPDSREFMSHEEMHRKQIILNKHLQGEDTAEIKEDEGIWDKAKQIGKEVKDAVFEGAFKVKNFFTG
jgi:hypothetical protein